MKELSWFVLVLAGALSSSLALSETKEKMTDINVCYISYREEMATAALYAADKKGFFAENGIRIHWKKDHKLPAKYFYKNNNLGLMGKAATYAFGEMSSADELREGRCDVASSTFEAILGAGFVDLKAFQPLAAYRYGKDYDTHLAQRADLHIKNLSELKGKRIRASGIAVMVILDSILKSVGLTLNDVDAQLDDVASLAADFDSKKADLVIAYVPTVPMLLASNRVTILEKNVYSRFLKGTSVPHSLLVANRTFAKQHSEILKKFMLGFKQGAKEISKHPENVIYGADIIDYPEKVYAKKDIEKSLNFFSVQEPLYADADQKSFFNKAQFVQYQKELVDRYFIKKPADLSPWSEVVE